MTDGTALREIATEILIEIFEKDVTVKLGYLKSLTLLCP